MPATFPLIMFLHMITLKSDGGYNYEVLRYDVSFTLLLLSHS